MTGKFFRLVARAQFGGLVLLGLTMPTAKAQQSASAPGEVKITTADSLRPVTIDPARLEIDYIAGTAALSRRQWTHAIIAFERILEINADFRDVPKKLALAERRLKRESTESILSRYYNDATSAMARDDWGWARHALKKINQIKPDYRDAGDLLTQIENMLQQTAQATTITARLDSLYREGMQAFDRADWKHAIANLENLQFLQPNYRNSASQLDRAWQNIGPTPPANGRPESNSGAIQSFFVGAMVAAFIVLSAAGFMGFSPTTRARYYLWRGHDKAAAQIYEKLLDRDPHRVKLYPQLAEIYLRLGSSDERAMKAYKTVLSLNLATHQREAINAIVAQDYLTEGRIDTDAIGVLEDALK
jgi:tetratricopeptide (TPR) repeat protein